MVKDQDQHFRNWLLQPGHHRHVLTLKSSVKDILGLDIKFHSWSEIYRSFELATSHSETSLSAFFNIFEIEPPTIEKGATKHQLMLYRGARSSKGATVPTPSDQEYKDKKVIYRGGTVASTQHKQSNHNVPAQDLSSEAVKSTNKAKRFYRGVEVKE